MTLAALATVGGGIAAYRSLRPREVMAAGQAPRMMLAGEPAVVPGAVDHGPAGAPRDVASPAARASATASVAPKPRPALRAPVTRPAAGRRSVEAAHRVAVTVAAPSGSASASAMAPASAGSAPAAPQPLSAGAGAGATDIVRAPRAAGELPPALAEEVALLDQAEAFVRRQAYRKALARLNEHDRRFPDGALEQEASVLGIAVRVGIGDREGAETRARQFLARHGDGILAARVRSMIALRAR
jgi:TolA-binding protein